MGGQKKDVAKQKWIDALLSSFSEDDLKEVIERVQSHLEQRKSSFQIPVEIFSENLAPAEAVVKYLKENKKLDYHEIADVLNRDERGIWSTYRRAREKSGKLFEITHPKELIPASIFSDRTYSILEALLLHLKDERRWKMREISGLLKKSYSTIYTTYQRAVRKRGGK